MESNLFLILSPTAKIPSTQTSLITSLVMSITLGSVPPLIFGG